MVNHPLISSWDGKTKQLLLLHEKTLCAYIAYCLRAFSVAAFFARTKLRRTYKTSGKWCLSYIYKTFSQKTSLIESFNIFLAVLEKSDAVPCYGSNEKRNIHEPWTQCTPYERRNHEIVDRTWLCKNCAGLINWWIIEF